MNKKKIMNNFKSYKHRYEMFLSFAKVVKYDFNKYLNTTILSNEVVNTIDTMINKRIIYSPCRKIHITTINFSRDNIYDDVNKKINEYIGFDIRKYNDYSTMRYSKFEINKAGDISFIHYGNEIFFKTIPLCDEMTYISHKNKLLKYYVENSENNDYYLYHDDILVVNKYTHDEREYIMEHDELGRYR